MEGVYFQTFPSSQSQGERHLLDRPVATPCRQDMGTKEVFQSSDVFDNKKWTEVFQS